MRIVGRQIRNGQLMKWRARVYIPYIRFAIFLMYTFTYKFGLFATIRNTWTCIRAIDQKGFRFFASARNWILLWFLFEAYPTTLSQVHCYLWMCCSLRHFFYYFPNELVLIVKPKTSTIYFCRLLNGCVSCSYTVKLWNNDYFSNSSQTAEDTEVIIFIHVAFDTKEAHGFLILAARSLWWRTEQFMTWSIKCDGFNWLVSCNIREVRR